MIKGLDKLCRLSLLIGLISLIAACSSQPIVINHYLLNMSDPSAREIIESDSDLSILITDILLPDYLNSSNLVMQQGNGILSVATKHVWAQPLDSGFGTLLANSLNEQDGLSAFYGAHNASIMKVFSANSDVQLAIVVEHFMPIGTGEVVLIGYWQSAAKDAMAKPKRFEFRRALEADGYIHSVEKMRMLVKDLSNTISNELLKETHT